jgi:hypothetical protein
MACKADSMYVCAHDLIDEIEADGPEGGVVVLS